MYKVNFTIIYIQKNFIITLHYMKSIYFSYKEVLQNITHNKEACIDFLKKKTELFKTV